MRRTILLASLFAAFFFTPGLYAQRSVVGEVFSIKGRPEFSHDSFGKRMVVPGSAVYGNDLVKTDPASNVVISFFDGTFLKVGVGAQLRLTKYVYDNDRNLASAQLDLIVGQLRIWTEKKLKDELMQVRTANAVAGVRGTEFEMSYRPTLESSLIAVLEGKVFFFNRQIGREDGTVIPSNHWGEIKGGKPPSKALELDEKPADMELLIDSRSAKFIVKNLSILQIY